MRYRSLLAGVLFLGLVCCAEAGADDTSPAAAASKDERIKAFCIDFNWGPGGFAAPGMYAGASAQKHFEWYRDIGVNTIQTFCVSCPGYAWYNSEVAPVQPGMTGEFLPDLAIGHYGCPVLWRFFH